MERNAQHPRLALSERVAMTDNVEENAHDAEREESAEQRRQNQEQQVDEMTPVGPDERPRTHREAKDVARAEPARLGKRNFARWRRCDDAVRDAICRFSSQLITRESVGAGGASDREDLVLQNEFRL